MQELCADALRSEGLGRAQTMDSTAPGCGCEACSHSGFGQVKGPEILERLVLSPRHVRSGQIYASALSNAETVGLSAFRQAHTTDIEVRGAAVKILSEGRLRDPKMGVFGALIFAAEEVKQPHPPEQDLVPYCVYDWPHAGVEGHVDVFQRVQSVADMMRQARRAWMFGRLKGSFVTVEKYRDGLLLDLAPPDYVAAQV
jgi:hypothetical protein